MARTRQNIYQSRDGRYESQYRMSFREAAERWQKACYPTLASSSQTSYQRSLEKHLLPELEKVEIGVLTPEGIDAAVERIAARSREHGRELKPRTLIFIRDLIRKIVDFALTGELERKQGSLIKNEGKTFEELETWQIEKLCIYAKFNHSVEMMSVLLMLFAGIRSGEMCALEWEDVNLEKREIYIHRTAHRVYLVDDSNDGRKTEVRSEEISWRNQVRWVRLPDELADYVSEYYKPGMSVLTGLPHTPLDQRTLIYRLDRLFDACKLPGVNAQRLRKTWKNGNADIGIWKKVISGPKAAEADTETDQDDEKQGLFVVFSQNEEQSRTLQRGKLIHLMGAEFSTLCEEQGMSMAQLAGLVGVDMERLRAVENGEQNFTWAEVLSLLLLFGGDEAGQYAVEKRGLFPPELKAMLPARQQLADRVMMQ